MKRTLFIINLTLVTAAIYMGVHIFYKLLEAKLDGVPIVDTYQAPSATAESSPVPPFSSYKAIAKRNLFKIQSGDLKAPAKTVAIDKLKQTELKLKLWGTVIDDDGRAYAVIEDSAKREQNLYHTGDAIQNASVKMILREKVILYVDGKDEILGMEKMVGAASGKRVRSPTSRSGARPIRSQKIVINKDQLAGALENVNELMKQAKIRPHFRDGKPDGLLLTGIKPKSIFRKMGLRNGDILMGVNEDDIRSVDDALKFYQGLGSTDSAKVLIKRRGRLRTMEYTVQ
jgi:general secretion pathway protein C